MLACIHRNYQSTLPNNTIVWILLFITILVNQCIIIALPTYDQKSKIEYRGELAGLVNSKNEFMATNRRANSMANSNTNYHSISNTDRSITSLPTEFTSSSFSYSGGIYQPGEVDLKNYAPVRDESVYLPSYDLRNNVDLVEPKNYYEGQSYVRQVFQPRTIALNEYRIGGDSNIRERDEQHQSTTHNAQLQDHVEAPIEYTQHSATAHYEEQPITFQHQPSTLNNRHQQIDHKFPYSQQDIVGLNKRSQSQNIFLPPITTTIYHTADSSKAISGVPLSKHIEITKHVPIAQYQKQHMPYKQTVQIPVPRPLITTESRPTPIKIPIPKTIAVPQMQEVKIPIEKVSPVPIERSIPFLVERRVPYQVEKAVAKPIYYPYPVKVPVVRTVVHRQIPVHASGTVHWNAANHLLG